ncbi:MAG: DNA mismatch repair endonuclease MutL [bacterium]
MTEQPSIRVLPIDVANMIAAGEVVDRPCSVLKELMENAFDAGASRIDVEVVAGGRKLVAVSDNGFGMNRDDALLSIERHATSKIRDVHDIERIATLGFRGEALAAVSSVSRFRILTCRRGDTIGTELVMTGGKLQDVRDAGVPPGTRVEVRDLFYNVPARRKFLRSEQTEVSHIRQVFMVQALAHPVVGMSLKVDGRELYGLADGATLEDRIRDMFGAEFVRKIRPVDHKQSGVDVSGFAGVPANSRADRNEQFIFINGRPTSAALLNYAIGQGYHALLPGSRFPAVFLNIRLDPALVDVNVHPTKKEVRFKRPDETRDAVIEAVRKALSGDGSSASAKPDAAGQAGTPLAGGRLAPEEVRLAIQDLPPTRSFQYPRMPVIPDRSVSSSEAGRPVSAQKTGQDAGAAPEPPAAVGQAPWSWCRVLAQVGGLYVLLETEDGFVVMDPHAAHERILYERFMASVAGHGTVEGQGLLMPETVELGPADGLRIRKSIDLLRKLGFGISEFGGDAFVVDALPAIFPETPVRALLSDIAVALEQAGPRGGVSAWKEAAIVQAACKTAVKARDRMTLQEIEQLVVDLAKTEMPYTCPHGRPTLIFTSFTELDRKFGRGAS